MQEITRSVLDLASARQNLAELIAQVKGSSGAEVENHLVEEKLRAEMAAYARKIGLDENLANKLVSELLEYSKITQRKKIHLDYIREHLRSNGVKTVSIFGAGRMGEWFARYFVEVGAKVLLYDANASLSRSKARKIGCGYAGSFVEAAVSDLQIIAVPIRVASHEIRRLVKFWKVNPEHAGKIIEISSIKNEIEKAGLTKQGNLQTSVELFSIHPLFGSNANPFSANSLVHIGNKSEFVKGIFPHYKIFCMNARNHDRLMSTLLTMPHVHALSFASSVAKRKKSIPEQITSPSFDHLLELSKKTLKESADVYYEIQATNPYAGKAMADASSSVRKIKGLLRDKSAFRKFFAETGRALN